MLLPIPYSNCNHKEGIKIRIFVMDQDCRWHVGICVGMATTLSAVDMLMMDYYTRSFLNLFFHPYSLISRRTSPIFWQLRIQPWAPQSNATFHAERLIATDFLQSSYTMSAIPLLISYIIWTRVTSGYSDPKLSVSLLVVQRLIMYMEHPCRLL